MPRLLLLLACFWVTGLVARADAADPALAAASQLIPNFHVVAPGIFRGGNPIDKPDMGTKGFDALKGLGVNTVVDLQGGDIDNSVYGWVSGQMEPGEHLGMIGKEKSMAEQLGMGWQNFPLNSHDFVNKQEEGDVWKAVMTLADPAKRPVFLHCEHGSDRTGLIVALYRVLYQGWTREAAMQEWRELGHGWESELVTGQLDDFFYRATGDSARADQLDYYYSHVFVEGMPMPIPYTTMPDLPVTSCIGNELRGEQPNRP